MTTVPARPREGFKAVAGAAVPQPRADWGEDDVPIVLRLPDIHALPPAAPQQAAPAATVPLPEPVRAAQPLPLWLFLVVAAIGVLMGLVALNRWKAYRAANPPKASEGIHQPVPTWKEPRGARSPSATTGESPAGQIASAAPENPQAMPAAEAAEHASERAGGAVRQAAATSPVAPTAPAPRNRHFGPTALPGNAGGAAPASDAADALPLVANRPQAAFDEAPAPSSAPGVAELNGQIVKPQPRPTYDSARPGLH